MPVVGCALCLAVQISILAACDGRPVLTWHGVKLDAIVSVLSTAGHGILVVCERELAVLTAGTGSLDRPLRTTGAV